MTINRSRLIPLAALAVVAIAAGLLAWRATSGPPASHYTGTALVGGPFTLVDQSGRAVDQTLLDGKWTAVFFGFTYCPDVCPTTLQTLALAQTQLGSKAKDLQVVFVSVDPERDTPPQLKSYLSSPAFPRNTIGLTGTPVQVAAAAKAYRAYFQKEGEGVDYVVNHSSVIYLMDPKGRFNKVLAYGMSPDDMARQIGSAMREGPLKG